MSVKRLFDRKLLWGLLFSVVTLLSALALAASLVVSGTLPEDAGGGAVCVAYYLAAVMGGRISMGGKKLLNKSLLCAGCVVALSWLVSLLSQRTPALDLHALTVILCALCGAVTAVMTVSPEKKRKSKTQKGRGGRHK